MHGERDPSQKGPQEGENPFLHLKKEDRLLFAKFIGGTNSIIAAIDIFVGTPFRCFQALFGRVFGSVFGPSHKQANLFLALAGVVTSLPFVAKLLNKNHAENLQDVLEGLEKDLDLSGETAYFDNKGSLKSDKEESVKTLLTEHLYVQKIYHLTPTITTERKGFIFKKPITTVKYQLCDTLKNIMAQPTLTFNQLLSTLGIDLPQEEGESTYHAVKEFLKTAHDSAENIERHEAIATLEYLAPLFFNEDGSLNQRMTIGKSHEKFLTNLNDFSVKKAVLNHGKDVAWNGMMAFWIMWFIFDVKHNDTNQDDWHFYEILTAVAVGLFFAVANALVKAARWIKSKFSKKEAETDDTLTQAKEEDYNNTAVIRETFQRFAIKERSENLLAKVGSDPAYGKTLDKLPTWKKALKSLKTVVTAPFVFIHFLFFPTKKTTQQYIARVRENALLDESNQFEAGYKLEIAKKEPNAATLERGKIVVYKKANLIFAKYRLPNGDLVNERLDITGNHFGCGALNMRIANSSTELQQREKKLLLKSLGKALPSEIYSQLTANKPLGFKAGFKKAVAKANLVADGTWQGVVWALLVWFGSAITYVVSRSFKPAFKAVDHFINSPISGNLLFVIPFVIGWGIALAGSFLGFSLFGFKSEKQQRREAEEGLAQSLIKNQASLKSLQEIETEIEKLCNEISSAGYIPLKNAVFDHTSDRQMRRLKKTTTADAAKTIFKQFINRIYVLIGTLGGGILRMRLLALPILGMLLIPMTWPIAAAFLGFGLLWGIRAIYQYAKQRQLERAKEFVDQATVRLECAAANLAVLREQKAKLQEGNGYTTAQPSAPDDTVQPSAPDYNQLPTAKHLGGNLSSIEGSPLPPLPSGGGLAGPVNNSTAKAPTCANCTDSLILSQLNKNPNKSTAKPARPETETPAAECSNCSDIKQSAALLAADRNITTTAEPDETIQNRYSNVAPAA